MSTTWLELLIGMLLYGLPPKAATRHSIGPIISQCLHTRADLDQPLPEGLFPTLMEELLPVSCIAAQPNRVRSVTSSHVCSIN